MYCKTENNRNLKEKSGKKVTLRRKNTNITVQSTVERL